MTANYFKVALRNLRKHKAYSAMNATGLALGVAMSILAFLFVQDEYRFDRFHERADRLHLVVYSMSPEITADGERTNLIFTPPSMGPALGEEIPEIERWTRMRTYELVLKRPDATFREDVLFAEPAFFEMFTFPLVRGNPSTALSSPDGVILTEAAAHKYFGQDDPMGRPLQVQFAGTFRDVVVRGIVATPPAASSIQFDVLLPYQQLIDFSPGGFDVGWQGPSVYTFVELAEGADMESVKAELPAFTDRHLGDVLEQRGQPRRGVRTELAPFIGYHTNTALDSWPRYQPLGAPISNPTYSYALMAIALVVLGIACINYITFNTGYSAGRSREVGVRKVLGASSVDIRRQFWGETLLLTVIAVGLGVSLALVSLPVFSELTGKVLTGRALFRPGILASITVLWLVVSLLAGAYPTLRLAGFTPAAALKDQLGLGRRRTLGLALVGLQFVGAIVLVVSLLVMSRQMRLIQDTSMETTDNQVMIVRNQGLPGRPGGEGLLDAYRALKKRLEAFDVLAVTAAYGTVDDDLWFTAYAHEGHTDIDDFMEDGTEARLFAVDYNYLDVYDFDLIAGRFHAVDRPADARGALVVNEAFVREMGLSDPIGVRLHTFPATDLQDDVVEIVGVVRDFHFESVHEAVKPAAFIPLTPAIPTRYISIKISPDDVGRSLDVARTAWHEIHPDLPFEYTFYDERFGQVYETERRWRGIVGYATGVGLFIACLGVFGLSSLAAVSRRKEAAIRKALGARAAGIALRFSREFAVPVTAAFVVAAPLAYFLMQRWLDDYAYRVEVGPDVFLLAGGAALGVALITISYHALKTATANPVETLRYE